MESKKTQLETRTTRLTQKSSEIAICQSVSKNSSSSNNNHKKRKKFTIQTIFHLKKVTAAILASL